MVDLNLSIVEQGIKDVLAQQVKNKIWDWIREIKTYGGEFDDGTLAWVETFPAIWVTFQGSGTPEKISNDKTKYPVTFVVLAGARSLRNEEAQRHGAGRDIGTYLMLWHIQKLLIGNDLSSVGVTGLASLSLGRTKTIFNSKTRSHSMSVLSQEFHTHFTITASDRVREEEEIDADLIRINVDYHFEPDDGFKDESDLIELKENT
ncbi:MULTISPECIES: phage protein Gp37 [Acinetobacter]|uniref:DUF1834 family protein n=1 Tax=Acinetobacter higginsii TaxID=70347 RepID=N9SU59_9GAMM|nr:MULTISPECIES: phage protein Gp37 [Acinetobacter]ENX58201.1 hypothetical protein F902_02601 [Acinetobacter higginsii]MCJ0829698.1 DUF1834 family protein [Acinetobacter sp. NIPH1876]